jgi:hypothetical protein
MLLLSLAILVAVVAVVANHKRQDRDVDPDELDYRGMVELHAIRRRFDLARFRVELGRDAADARRGLRDELRRLDEREQS